MKRIRFYLYKCAPRVRFFIDHWVESTSLRFRHIEHTYSEFRATVEYGVQMASVDISYSLARFINSITAKFTSKDTDTSSARMVSIASAMLKELHHHQDRMAIEYTLSAKPWSYDTAFAQVRVVAEYSAKMLSTDAVYTMAKFVNRIGYYFTSKDVDVTRAKVVYANKAKALETHYQYDRCVIQNDAAFKLRHLDIDNSSMICRYFIPIFLKDYTFTIGDPSILLKDWCFEQL